MVPLGPRRAQPTAYSRSAMRPRSLTNLPPVERHVGDRRGRIADGGDDQRRRNLIRLAGAARGAAFVELGALDDDPLDLALAFDRAPAWRRNRRPCAWACPAAGRRSRAACVTDLRRPGSSGSSASSGGKSAGSTIGTAASRWPSSPSSLGVMAIWCGPRRPRMVMVRIAERVERVERVADDVRAFEFVRASSTGCARNRARHCRCR